MAMWDGGVETSRLAVECSRRISERASDERRGSVTTVREAIFGRLFVKGFGGMLVVKYGSALFGWELEMSLSKICLAED